MLFTRTARVAEGAHAARGAAGGTRPGHDGHGARPGGAAIGDGDAGRVSRVGARGHDREGARGGGQGGARLGEARGWGGGGPGGWGGVGGGGGGGGGRKKRKGRERGEGSPRGSKFGDQHLQNLGHHGEEREVGESGSCAWEKLNEGKEIRGGGRDIWRGRAPGARGPRPNRAGLGRTAGQNLMARTTTDRNPIRETKFETRLSNTRD
jgi:hypothetical protein